MPLEYHVDTLPLNAAPGGLTIVNTLSFQPKAIILFHCVVPNANLDLAGMLGCMGIFDGTDQFGTSFRSMWAVDPSETASIMGQDIFLGLDQPAPGLWDVSYVTRAVSLDPNGFTLMTEPDTSLPRATNYIAIGGAGVSAKAGQVALTPSPADDSVSLAFTPDLILFWNAGGQGSQTPIQSLPPLFPLGPQDLGKSHMFGMTDGTGNYVCSMHRENGVIVAASNRGGFESFAIPIHVTDPQGTVLAQATVTRKVDGFDITKTVVPGSNVDIFYLALSGVQTNIGFFSADEPLGGLKSIVGVGFQPEASMFFSDYLPGNCSGAGCNRFEFGAQADERAWPAGGDYAQCSWNGQDFDGTVKDSCKFTGDHAYEASEGFLGIDSENFTVDSYDADGFTIRNNGEKDPGGLQIQDVGFLMMKEGNNPLTTPSPGCERGKRCISDFGFVFNEYGVCGTASIPELGCIGIECAKLSPTPATSQFIEYDLGPDFATDFEIANIVVIEGLRAFLNIDDPLDVKIRASDDPSFVAFDEEICPVTIGDLVGPNQDTWIKRFTMLNPRRYWRVVVETPTAQNPVIEAVALGTELRLERSPTFPTRFRLLDELQESGRNPWEVSLEFDGVVEIHKEEIDRRMLSFSDVQPMWLHDAADALLFGNRTMRVALTREEIRPRRGTAGREYSLRFTFEEIV